MSAFLTPHHVLAQGWELARDHAMTAVGTDNQMRIWYSDNAALEGGLLFKCALGSVDLENPVGAPTWAPFVRGRAYASTRPAFLTENALTQRLARISLSCGRRLACQRR